MFTKNSENLNFTYIGDGKCVLSGRGACKDDRFNRASKLPIFRLCRELHIHMAKELVKHQFLFIL